jgi:hypothetical protein
MGALRPATAIEALDEKSLSQSGPGSFHHQHRVVIVNEWLWLTLL